MKNVFLPIGAAAAAVAVLASGCASSGLTEEEIAAHRAKLNQFEKEAVAYKTHQKQKDKYVLPNASLETSRALYLPVGGAMCDRAITLFGDSYVRLASQALHSSGNVKRWTTLKAEYAKYKESSAYKELLELTGNFIKKNPPSLADGQKYQKDPAILLEKIIQNTRVAEAYAFNKKYESAKDDSARKEILAEVQKKKNNLTAWYDLDGTAGKQSPSRVYRKYEAAKRAALAKLEAENKAARQAALEAHAKTAAFVAYWSSVVGKKLYPVVVPMIPAQSPLDAALAASVPAADIAFDATIKTLSNKYSFLPTSLQPDFSDAPNLKKLLDGGSSSLNAMMDKLGDKAFVDSLMDKQLIAKAKDPKGYVMNNMKVSNPFEIPNKVKAINEEIAPAMKAIPRIQASLDGKDYGAVALDSLNAFGNSVGKELVIVINNELKPYKYANDIATKRIEYTGKAIKWLTEGTLEDLASSGAF